MTTPMKTTTLEMMITAADDKDQAVGEGKRMNGSGESVEVGGGY